jgi:hypothetical protein
MNRSRRRRTTKSIHNSAAKTVYRIGFPVTDQNTGQSYNGLVELSNGKELLHR